MLVVGAGGLGSPILFHLAAAGVGTLGIVDFDTVEESNLQRQIIHGCADVGRSKTHSARDSIAALNPLVTVDMHDLRLAPDNAVELFGRYDLIIDGTDNFATRYLINDAAVLALQALRLGRGPGLRRPGLGVLGTRPGRPGRAAARAELSRPASGKHRRNRCRPAPRAACWALPAPRSPRRWEPRPSSSSPESVSHCWVGC